MKKPYTEPNCNVIIINKGTFLCQSTGEKIQNEEDISSEFIWS